MSMENTSMEKYAEAVGSIPPLRLYTRDRNIYDMKVVDSGNPKSGNILSSMEPNGPRRFGAYVFDSKELKDRYVLFQASLTSKQPKRRRFIRCSGDGELSHLGIAGMSLKEFSGKFDVDMGDDFFIQSHHNEEPTIVRKDYDARNRFELNALGGGFINVENHKDGILFGGASDKLGPGKVSSPVGLHLYAVGAMLDFLRDEGNPKYEFCIKELEGASQKQIESLANGLKRIRGKDPGMVIYMLGNMDKIGTMDSFEEPLRNVIYEIRDIMRP